MCGCVFCVRVGEYVCVCVFVCRVCVWCVGGCCEPSFSCGVNYTAMGWLRLVVSLKSYISFAEYRLFYRALLQKRPVILRSQLMVATPYPYVSLLWYCVYQRERFLFRRLKLHPKFRQSPFLALGEHLREHYIHPYH